MRLKCLGVSVTRPDRRGGDSRMQRREGPTVKALGWDFNSCERKAAEGTKANK